MSSPGHEWTKHEREGWSVCSRCGMVRNYDRETTCSGSLPKIRQRSEIEDCGQGEHNVLALIDHYQRNSMEADERSPGHDELRRFREQGRAPAGSCPFCASRISVVERDGVFVARCSHRGCGARGPKHHDLTRACDLFCRPPQRTAGGMGGIDAGGAL